MQNQEQPQTEFTFQDSVNWTYFITSSLATCLTVFTRHQFGSEAFRFDAVCALLILILTAAFSHDDYITLMCLLWVAFLITHRGQTFRNWRKGIHLHSRYAGEPGMAMLFVKDEVRARWLEPFLCAGIGLALSYLSQSLSQFVLVCSVALLIRTWMETETGRVQLRNLRDAEIEQQSLIEHWQKNRGEF